MNHSLIIKATNRVALYATVAFFFLVIVFLTITVFDLKIFHDHMTETFYLSILGIFAILFGALIINLSLKSKLQRSGIFIALQTTETPSSIGATSATFRSAGA
jgi:hypothetical protein